MVIHSNIIAIVLKFDNVTIIRIFVKYWNQDIHQDIQIVNSLSVSALVFYSEDKHCNVLHLMFLYIIHYKYGVPVISVTT